jgi:hypothetical protein
MASQKISQFTPVVTLASGDFFPVVLSTDGTNKRADVGVLDNRYTSAASGVSLFVLSEAALASGSEAQLTADDALASGNFALVAANTALASGNGALTLSSTKYAISGGLVDGQMTTVVTALGLNGSGIPCSSGNYFTATLSGASSVYFIGVPSGAYGLTYEVQNDTGTITWPNEVKWPADTPPVLTTGKTHLFIFVTDDGGSRWRAASLVDYTT